MSKIVARGAADLRHGRVKGRGAEEDTCDLSRGERKEKREKERRDRKSRRKIRINETKKMVQIPGRNEVEQREGEKGRRMTEASKSVLFMKLRSVPFQFRPRCPELRASLLWALPSLRHPPQSTLNALLYIALDALLPGCSLFDRHVVFNGRCRSAVLE